MKKELFAGLAVFLAALLVGFLGEKGALESSNLSTRAQVAEEMARVLKTLRPVLRAEFPGCALPTDGENREAMAGNRPDGRSSDLASLDLRDPSPVSFSDYPDARDPALSLVFQLGVMKGFPEGTFRPDDRLTRGEGVAFFAALFDAVSGRLFRMPKVIDCPVAFQDVPDRHWLRPMLQKLAGINALSCFPAGAFAPQLPLTCKELKAMSRAFIDFFGANLFIMEVADSGVRLHPKGALDDLSLDGWTFSWNGSDWEGVPATGLIPFPGRFFQGLQLSLANPYFDRLGPVEIVKDPSTLWYLKVKKNMTRFRERVRQGLAGPSNDGDRNRLESHLAALRARLRKQDLGIVTSMGEMPRIGAGPSMPKELGFSGNSPRALSGKGTSYPPLSPSEEGAGRERSGPVDAPSQPAEEVISLACDSGAADAGNRDSRPYPGDPRPESPGKKLLQPMGENFAAAAGSRPEPLEPSLDEEILPMLAESPAVEESPAVDRGLPWEKRFNTGKESLRPFRRVAVGVAPVSARPQGNGSRPSAPMAREMVRREISPAARIQVVGRIVDQQSRKGVGGATILYGNKDFTSGPDGRFAFSTTSRRALELTVYCEGYEPFYWKADASSPGEDLELAVKPLHTFMEGVVKEFETGNPIRNAQIQVANQLVRTGPDGSFRVPKVMPTYHQISCRAPGYMDALEVVYVAPRNNRKEIRLRRSGPADSLSDTQVAGAHRSHDFGD